MTTLWLDLETYSETPIKNGAHRYAEDAEVLLVAVAVDDDPVVVWDTSNPETRGSQMAALQGMIDRADRVVIHNSAFDRTVLRVAHGVHIPLEKTEDTMVLALMHSLPASLGMLCDVLGVPSDKAKDKDGRKLINIFCKPRPKNAKLRRATRETHPDEWTAFVEYARLDVDAMRDIRGRLPRWNCNESERGLWRIDQNANDRGIAVDIGLARSALRAFERASRSLAARASNLTGGVVGSATQRGALLDHLRVTHGVDMADMTGATVTRLLREDVTPEVRELLQIRKQAAATSPAKYRALLGAASSDGRLRGTVQFCGAGRTGRDAGRIFQPQNLTRTPDWFDETVQEITIAAFKADAEDLIWENVSDRCAMSVRGCLMASTGMKLCVADLSNIEGRVLAWLAGEEWKIEAFKAYDRGVGPDLYKVTAGRILGKDPYKVTKPERQTQGKVPELAGGYGGGLGAYRKMGGKVFDAMTDEAINEIVQAWRKAHPATVRLWYAVEGACRDAIRNPGESFEVRGLIRFDQVDGPDGVPYVRCRLPSGRYLCYRDMHIDEGRSCPACNGNSEVMVGPVERGEMIPALRTGRVCPTCAGSGRSSGTGQILYEGLNQYTRKWELLDTYYGKLVENIVQAIARDVFMTGLRRAEEQGYPVVLRVHDELVCEVPDKPGFTHERLAGMMATSPSWSTGLPLAAAGFETRRYRKE
jgi:DNA polymerase